MRMLGLSGSLQAGSTNTALLRAAQALAGDDRLVIGAPLSDLPHFNPDLESSASLAAVDAFRHEVTVADAVVLASPEYAHGVPGVLKNALDWLVGTGELYEKSVAVVCGSPRPDGGTSLRRHLEDTLRAQGATVLTSVTIAVPPGDRSDPAADPEVRVALVGVLDALRRARPAVSSGGVDPATPGAPR